MTAPRALRGQSFSAGRPASRAAIPRMRLHFDFTGIGDEGLAAARRAFRRFLEENPRELPGAGRRDDERRPDDILPLHAGLPVDVDHDRREPLICPVCGHDLNDRELAPVADQAGGDGPCLKRLQHLGHSLTSWVRSLGRVRGVQ